MSTEYLIQFYLHQYMSNLHNYNIMHRVIKMVSRTSNGVVGHGGYPHTACRREGGSAIVE